MTLDQTQTGIVEHVGRLSNCLLVTGGPGTGKTTALVAAVASLVRAGTPLDQVVVLAHARPAAFRLRRQVMAAIGVTQAGPRITTTHGWCRLLLNTYAEDGPAQLLLSAPEQEFRVRELLPATHWPADLGQAYLTPAFAGQVRALLTRARQLGLDPAGLAASGQIAGRADWVAAAEFFEGYLDVIDSEGVLDYAELVHRSRLLLAQDAVATAVTAHTKAVLVDDFAECDESMTALLRDIWRAGVPVTAFADPSTRILGFRGAWPGAVSRFPDEFASSGGPATVVQLNHRWRQADVGEAWVAETPGDEPSMLAEQLWRAHAEGAPWQDMAVIGRAGGHELTSLARGLADAGVPVRQEGETLALADVPAVRLILSGVELVVALSKGEATEQQWLDLLGSPLVGLDLIDLRRPDEDTTAKRETVVAAITSLAAGLESTHFSELAWGVWTLGDWPDRLRRASLDRGEAALRADRDLDAVIALFDLAGSRNLTGAAGVEAVAALVGQQVVQRDRAREAEDPPGVVTVLSAYGAKGRQWPVVAVCGAVESAWPMSGSTWSLLEPDRLCADGQLPPTTRGEMVAAQRRLFALATSRASRRLIITGAPTGDGAALPSRFIAEMGLTPKNWSATRALALAPRDLVGQLRAAAVSPDESPALVDAAAALLGRLADLRRPDGRAAVPAADPKRWWWVGGLSRGVDLPNRAVRLAASSVWLLLGCPRRWFVEKQAGASPPMGDAAWLGQLAHWMFETYATTTPEAGELEDALRAKTADVPLSMGWRLEAQWQGLLDCFERYRTWRDGRANRTFVATETSFRQNWPTTLGPVEVHGRVDRLELDRAGRLVVIDFKTSRTRNKALFSDQLGIYTVAARRGAFAGSGIVANTVALPELVWPGVNPRRADVGCPVDQADDVDEGVVMQRIEQAAAIIRSERFPATPGDDICRSCAFTEGCPATALAGVACMS